MELAAQPFEVFADDLLAGHVAIVTGGGTNLGKAAAAELARCGANVVIAARREDVLADAAAQIGPRCTWVAGDIREAADCERIVGRRARAPRPRRHAAQQRRRPVPRGRRGHHAQGVGRARRARSRSGGSVSRASSAGSPRSSPRRSGSR